MELSQILVRWRRAVPALLLLVSSLTLAACAPHEPEMITVSATPPPHIIGPDNFPPGVNPLTGERVYNPAVLNRRPLAVKISNAPDTVRPQAGIGAADLVFEHYVEGGLNSFYGDLLDQHAVPGRIGAQRPPDRSGNSSDVWDALCLFRGQ